MKKLILLAGLMLLLFSCDFTNPDTTVINNSSYTVLFKYSETNNIEKLSPNSSIDTNYFHTGIIIVNPEKRIAQDRDEGTITLSDLPSWDVHVENKTSNLVTLSADEWMDKITIPAGIFIDDENHKGKVYTKSPTFYVSSNTFPMIVQSQFVDGIFYVVIRD